MCRTQEELLPRTHVAPRWWFLSPGAPPAPVTTVVGRLFSIFLFFNSPSTVYWTVELGSKRWNLVPSSNATWRCALLFLKTIQNERGHRYWFIRVEKNWSWLIFYRKVWARKLSNLDCAQKVSLSLVPCINVFRFSKRCKCTVSPGKVTYKSPFFVGKKARFLGKKIENSWFSPKNWGDL